MATDLDAEAKKAAFRARAAAAVVARRKAETPADADARKAAIRAVAARLAAETFRRMK